MHQPRDSAVFFPKQTAPAAACEQRASVEQMSTDGEGRRRGEAVIYILPSPFFARLCDTAGRQSFAQHSPPQRAGTPPRAARASLATPSDIARPILTPPATSNDVHDGK